MRLLFWLIRFIVVALVINMVIRFVLSMRRAPSTGAPGGSGPRRPTTGGRGSRVPERLGGTLVRDPQCGTYIPQSGALPLGTGSAAHYFCSDRCRTDWTAAHPS